MSRKIGFRAWDIKNKRFVNIVRLIFDQFGALDYADVVFKGKIYKLYPSDIVLEQDTGLDDKNGKRIYEGDIVKWVDGLGEKHIFEIIWNECRASFQMVEIGQKYPYILQGLSDKMKPYCEVIGNIHENGDL